LVKLLLGDTGLKPLGGEIRRNPQVRIALVNQHHADQLPLDRSPLEFMVAKFPGMLSVYFLISLSTIVNLSAISGQLSLWDYF
jgi:ATPase subunit of ABC transporter with duplicated ATPase domains